MGDSRWVEQPADATANAAASTTTTIRIACMPLLVFLALITAPSTSPNPHNLRFVSQADANAIVWRRERFSDLWAARLRQRAAAADKTRLRRSPTPSSVTVRASS